MKLVRNINSTYVEVNRNIKILEKEGIVIDKRFGRLRIIKLNYENNNTKLLLKVLRILDPPRIVDSIIDKTFNF